MDCLACYTPNSDGSRFCGKCSAPLPTAQAAEADSLIGKVVGGRYRITGILGEGGMGRVYTSEQQMGTSVRKVAVKTLLAQFARDPQTVARFMREVGTVSELEHPNTIKVYDFGQVEESGELYIAMELLSGQTLEEALTRSGPMSPERVDRIMGQVCGSLQEAHDKGIVHRDIKPANIFLTTRAGEQDVVKVLDFGIATRGESIDAKGKTEQKLTKQGTVLGTPPYMSPEQFSGREIDARSDLYSLAVVTYELLTGRLPWEASTPWEWMNRHLEVLPCPFENFAAGAGIPHKMKSSVLRVLEKDRERRPQNARAFHEELTLVPNRASMPMGGIAEMDVPTAGAQAYVAPPTPPKAGNGLVFGALGFIVLAGGSAGWYFLVGPGRHPTVTTLSISDSGEPTTTSGGSGSVSVAKSAEPSSTPAVPSTAIPSASVAPSAKTEPSGAPSATSTVQRVDPNCCASIKEPSKKSICRGTIASLNAGRVSHGSGVAQANAQGGHCR